MEEFIKGRYNDPSAPGSFQGPDKLYQSNKRNGVKKSQIKNYLKKEDTYTLNRAVRYKFPRNRVVAESIDYMWDVDNADLSLLYKENKGYKYFLLAIDVFSRYCWVRPLKTKYSKEIIKALSSIFSEGRIPITMRTDRGRELNNREVQRFLSQQGVHHYTTYNEVQANYSERCIKTIKSKLYRYMISRNTLRYIDVLQDIVHSYNNTVHSSLGIPPSKVNKKNESEVLHEQYKRRRKPKEDSDNPWQKMKFKPGDQVRITYRREAFDREYGQKWSGEIFYVTKAWRRNTIPVYRLADWNGEEIKGTFYNQQLQSVNVDREGIFKIEKILKRRRRNGVNQVLVKYLHWPKKFNEWINEDRVQDI